MLKNKIDAIKTMLGEKITNFSKKDVIITEFKGSKNEYLYFTVATIISIPLNVLDTNVINSLAMKVILNSEIEDRIESLVYILENTDNVTDIIRSRDKLIVKIEVTYTLPVIEHFPENENRILELLEYVEVLNLPTIYYAVETIQIAFSAYKDIVNSLLVENSYSQDYVIC